MISDTQRLLLDIISSQLFKKPLSNMDNADWMLLLKEAEQQSVFPLVFSALSGVLPEDIQPKAQSRYFTHIAASVRNAHQHGGLHKLMSDHGIPYVIIKGMASASYYPDPFLRSMGDVDFLVEKDSLERAKELLLREGYTTNENNKHHAHIAFHKSKEVLEMHWEPNGLPDGEKGALCRDYIKDTIKTARLYETKNDRFHIPDAFHHGLIMLLHIATHMINTGIGLRHLCDWAVFVGKLDEQEFTSMFEEKLKAVGLWRFSQLLTQLSVEYLACPEKTWAMEDVDNVLLESMITDIFNAGNFGKKDLERLNEAKLMTTSSTGTISGSSMVIFKGLTEKAYKVMPVCQKVKVLLPLAWLVVAIKHLVLIKRRKRPKVHIPKMIAGAETRREIYRQFQLFQ